MKQIRHTVFWPPFTVLIVAAVYSLVNTDGSLEITTTIYDWILDRFGFLFSIGALFFLILCMAAYFSCRIVFILCHCR